MVRGDHRYEACTWHPEFGSWMIESTPKLVRCCACGCSTRTRLFPPHQCTPCTLLTLPPRSLRWLHLRPASDREKHAAAPRSSLLCAGRE
jgi:hypothetical protein